MEELAEQEEDSRQKSWELMPVEELTEMTVVSIDNESNYEDFVSQNYAMVLHFLINLLN